MDRENKIKNAILKEFLELNFGFDDIVNLKELKERHSKGVRDISFLVKIHRDFDKELKTALKNKDELYEQMKKCKDVKKLISEKTPEEQKQKADKALDFINKYPLKNTKIGYEEACKECIKLDIYEHIRCMIKNEYNERYLLRKAQIIEKNKQMDKIF